MGLAVRVGQARKQNSLKASGSRRQNRAMCSTYSNGGRSSVPDLKPVLDVVGWDTMIPGRNGTSKNLNHFPGGETPHMSKLKIFSGTANLVGNVYYLFNCTLSSILCFLVGSHCEVGENYQSSFPLPFSKLALFYWSFQAQTYKLWFNLN